MLRFRNACSLDWAISMISCVPEIKVDSRRLPCLFRGACCECCCQLALGWRIECCVAFHGQICDPEAPALPPTHTRIRLPPSLFLTQPARLCPFRGRLLLLLQNRRRLGLGQRPRFRGILHTWLRSENAAVIISSHDCTPEAYPRVLLVSGGGPIAQ